MCRYVNGEQVNSARRRACGVSTSVEWWLRDLVPSFSVRTALYGVSAVVDRSGMLPFTSPFTALGRPLAAPSATLGTQVKPEPRGPRVSLSTSRTRALGPQRRSRIVVHEGALDCLIRWYSRSTSSDLGSIGVDFLQSTSIAACLMFCANGTRSWRLSGTLASGATLGLALQPSRCGTQPHGPLGDQLRNVLTWRWLWTWSCRQNDGCLMSQS